MIRTEQEVVLCVQTNEDCSNRPEMPFNGSRASPYVHMSKSAAESLCLCLLTCQGFLHPLYRIERDDVELCSVDHCSCSRYRVENNALNATSVKKTGHVWFCPADVGSCQSGQLHFHSVHV